MEFRQLGRSGLMVSVMSLGTMTFGGRGGFEKLGAVGVADAQRQIDLCLDAGVNLIDTADVYSTGESEEIVGEIMSGDRRKRALIATKVRFPTGPSPNDRGLSRHHIIKACEASLRRLRTDVIDLYQFHEWDGLTPLEETLEAVDRLIGQGKVRYVGCSNFSGWHIMKALGISQVEQRPRLVSQQIHYSLEAREAEYELLPIAVDQSVSVLVWSPLSGGLLSGKYRQDQRQIEGTRLSGGGFSMPIHDETRLWNIVEVLIEIGAARGVSAARIALAWLLGRPGITSIIIGGRSISQLEDNLAAAALRLTEDERKRLGDVSAPPILYPYWHQLHRAKDRLSPADLVLTSL